MEINIRVPQIELSFYLRILWMQDKTMKERNRNAVRQSTPRLLIGKDL